jgi:hypothetical protein
MGTSGLGFRLLLKSSDELCLYDFYEYRFANVCVPDSESK